MIDLRRERPDDVKRGRREDDLAALPSRVGFSGSYPFARFQLSSFDQRLLSFGHPREEKPGVEASWCERRRDPSAGRFKVGRHYLEAILFDRLSESLCVFSQLYSLCSDLLNREALSSARQQHAGFLKKLTHSARAHSCFFGLAADNPDGRVLFVELSARKSMKAAHELQLCAAFHPEHVRVFSIA